MKIFIGFSAMCLLSSYVYGADIQERYVSYSRTCASYVQNPNDGGYQGWIEGYLTALNEIMDGMVDIKEKLAITTEYLLVDSYFICKKEPQKGFAQVIIGLVDQYIEKMYTLQRY